MDDSYLGYLPLIGDGAGTTLLITATAIICGTAFGAFLSFLRFTENRFLEWFVSGYTYLFRGTPLVMVLLGLYLVAPGFLRNSFNMHADVRLATALIAFSFFEAAYFAEIFKSGINTVAKDQLPAAKSLGFTKTHAYRLFILPQAYQKIKPSLITQCINLFQDTSLVYVIGLQDFFGTITKIGERTGNIQLTIFIASLCYFGICLVTQRIADKIEDNNKKQELLARQTTFKTE